MAKQPKQNAQPANEQPATPPEQPATQPSQPGPAAAAHQSGPAPLRVRNLEIRTVRVGDILDNEDNFRTHDRFQKQSFRGTVKQIGFYGYPDVFIVPDGPDAGRLKLIDGELRKYDLLETYGPDQEIQVNVTDFNPQEAAVALATHDPISQLAGVNKDNLKTLTEKIGGNLNRDLTPLLDKLKTDNKLALENLPATEPTAPENFPVADENLPTEHACPSCGYKWIGQGGRKKKARAGM